MKRITATTKSATRILAACLSLWTIFLLSIVSVNLPGIQNNPGLTSILGGVALTTVVLASLASYPTALILLANKKADNPKTAKELPRPLARSLVLLIVIGLLISTLTAIRSLWFNPLAADWGTRFTYENVATGVNFGTIVLVIVLSWLQKDIYWVTSKADMLDERQIEQRRRVFETSYKLAALLVLIAVWYFTDTIHNLPTIMKYNFGQVPSHLFIPAYNLVITLFALPLLVAAHKTPVRKATRNN